MTNLNALILPGETVPRRSSIKRQLLFFDSVLLVHPDDAAIVNNGDVEEAFSDMTIRWTTCAPFPFAEGYADAMLQLVDETKQLQRSGKVRILRPEQVRPRLDPGIFFTSYMTSIADASLVRAAIPDLSPNAPPFTMPSGVYAGMGITRISVSSSSPQAATA